MQKRYDNNKIEDFINDDKSLIETMFSFTPEIREGYTDNKREQKIQKRLASQLYSKRMDIVGSIVNNNYTDKKEVLVSSLVSQGFAPRTLEPWIDYVVLLSERQGGWDIFLKELSAAYYSDKYFSIQLKTTILLGFVLTLPITFVIKLIHPYVDDIVSQSLWLINIAFFIAWIVFYVGGMRKEIEEVMASYKGKNNKKLSDNFIHATKLKCYLSS